MIRNLKILGIAMAALVLVAVLASAVTQATDVNPRLTAGKGTTGAAQNIKLEGNGTDEAFHAFGWTVTCEVTVFGPLTTPTPVSVPTNAFTIKPYHRMCTVPKVEEPVVTVVTNNCSFKTNITATAKDGAGQPIPDTYTATMDFECAKKEEAFELKVWFKGTDPGPMHEKAPSCLFKITPQTARPGVTIKVNTDKVLPDDLSIYGPVKNIHVEQTRNSVACPAGTTTNLGEYTFPAGGATLSATSEGGEALSAWID
jgi:hypothetical protein